MCVCVCFEKPSKKNGKKVNTIFDLLAFFFHFDFLTNYYCCDTIRCDTINPSVSETATYWPWKRASISYVLGISLSFSKCKHSTNITFNRHKPLTNENLSHSGHALSLLIAIFFLSFSFSLLKCHSGIINQMFDINLAAVQV